MRTLAIEERKEAQLKRYGGAEDDRWNNFVIARLGLALPTAAAAKEGEWSEAVAPAAAALKELAPATPQEAMLIAQMIAANAAALDLYRRAWVPEQSFEVRCRFLALADKAGQTVSRLSEALTKHRNGGRQTVVVQHLTVNADQAMVAENIVAGSPEGGRTTK